MKSYPSDVQRRVPALLVRDFARSLLVAGGSEKWVAEATADGLWFASLRGTDSHGLRLLPHYLGALQGGRINPRPSISFNRTAPSTGILDADHTFGHAAGIRAVEEAITLATETGVGLVSVANSSHCGAMAYFGLRPCAHDMLGLAFTHASPKLMTPGGTQSFFGTNPICFCAPMAEEDPLCFDSAQTIVTANYIKLLAESGLPLPAGLAADLDGNPTTDPSAAAQLMPIGDYKGFGLSMVVDVLCALLTKMPAGPDVSMMYLDPMHAKRYLGQFYGAVRISSFEDPEIFRRRLKDMCERIRQLPPARDGNVSPMPPGDPEKKAERDRRSRGIPISDGLLSELDMAAVQLGVAPLCTLLGGAG